MKRKVVQIIEGEWTPWNRFERWMCCDCFLLHEVNHRVRDGKLEVKMYRNNRSTAAYRRSGGIKLTVKKR